MLGRNEMPPSRGMAFLCTFRSLGMSYKFFRLQKSRIRGVNTIPQIKLNKNAPSRDIVISYFISRILNITAKTAFYCVLSYCFSIILASTIERRNLLTIISPFPVPFLFILHSNSTLIPVISHSILSPTFPNPSFALPPTVVRLLSDCCSIHERTINVYQM